MTTSAIRLDSGVVFVKDADLREFIKGVAIGLSTRSDLFWLVDACDNWVSDHEDMPPGLRDIELDDLLVDTSKRLIFREFLESLAGCDLENDIYDKQAFAMVAERINSKLL